MRCGARPTDLADDLPRDAKIAIHSGDDALASWIHMRETASERIRKRKSEHAR